MTSKISCARNTSPVSSKWPLTLIPQTWRFFLSDENKNDLELGIKPSPTDVTVLDLASGKPKEKDKETQGIQGARAYQSPNSIFLKWQVRLKE